MKLVAASDHAGVALKALIVEALRKAGHEVADLGTNTTDAVDYPEYAQKVALAVLSGQAERAILICGSGAGACVAAYWLSSNRVSAALKSAYLFHCPAIIAMLF